MIRESFQRIMLSVDIDLVGCSPEGLALDLDASTVLFQSNLENILRALSDQGLAQTLDWFEEYPDADDEIVRFRLAAGLTCLMIRSVRAERDRRLSGTAAR
ncbi:MAG: hypothetical protein ACRD20_18200 [Terriglobales bacterium]